MIFEKKSKGDKIVFFVLFDDGKSLSFSVSKDDAATVKTALKRGFQPRLFLVSGLLAFAHCYGTIRVYSASVDNREISPHRWPHCQ